MAQSLLASLEKRAGGSNRQPRDVCGGTQESLYAHPTLGSRGSTACLAAIPGVFPHMHSQFAPVIEGDGAIVPAGLSAGALKDGTPLSYGGVSGLETTDGHVHRLRTYDDSAVFLPQGTKGSQPTHGRAPHSHGGLSHSDTRHSHHERCHDGTNPNARQGFPGVIVVRETRFPHIAASAGPSGPQPSGPRPHTWHRACIEHEAPKQEGLNPTGRAMLSGSGRTRTVTSPRSRKL